MAGGPRAADGREPGRGWTARPPAGMSLPRRRPGCPATPARKRSPTSWSGWWWRRSARPGRTGTAQSWEALLGQEEQIRGWVRGVEVDGQKHDPLSLVKIEQLLARRGVVVPYRTLHRFAVERCGFRVGSTTVRVVDGEPGVECQIDFAQLGLLRDPETGRGRRVHVLIFTAVVSRHMFVWLTFSQTLTAVIAGCEAAWGFFGGAFKVLIPDNLKAVVTEADAVNPRLSPGWLDYAQHVGFGTDPARVRSPQDKPRVERAVQYVRGNFWAGESFTDLADAQSPRRDVVPGAGRDAGPRHHREAARRAVRRAGGWVSAAGAAALRPADLHPGQGAPRLPRRGRPGVVLGARASDRLTPGRPRRLASWSSSTPPAPAGGRLVKTHPRQPPGGRSTDRDDLPAEKAGYALRDLTRLVAVCAGHGPNIGIYAERLLDDPLPWTRMRAVYRLLGLVRRYGPGPVEAACGRSLDLDVVSVSKIAAMLANATEQHQPALPGVAGSPIHTPRAAGSPATPASTAPPVRSSSPSSPAASPTKEAHDDHPREPAARSTRSAPTCTAP